MFSRYVDSSDGAPIEEGDLVKGYAIGDNNCVFIDDEELESVRTMTSNVLLRPAALTISGATERIISRLTIRLAKKPLRGCATR